MAQTEQHTLCIIFWDYMIKSSHTSHSFLMVHSLYWARIFFLSFCFLISYAYHPTINIKSAHPVISWFDVEWFHVCSDCCWFCVPFDAHTLPNSVDLNATTIQCTDVTSFVVSISVDVCLILKSNPNLFQNYQNTRTLYNLHCVYGICILFFEAVHVSFLTKQFSQLLSYEKVVQANFAGWHDDDINVIAWWRQRPAAVK